ncbi:MAG: hypothetical protein E5W21_19575 [Mesorhizobium sp.]|nr:MAG: hypothetical protein E5W21_19575 [Mesorhizobium sp.]
MEANYGAFAQFWEEAMASEITPDTIHDSVEITENLGEWFVRVVRNGNATIKSFEVESYARAFAEGQRIGLGLHKPSMEGEVREDAWTDRHGQ